MECEPRKCVVCGKEFTPHVWQQICCSWKCKNARRRERELKWRRAKGIQPQQCGEKIVRECVVCGRPFIDKKNSSRVCSPECALVRKVQAQAELARPENSSCIPPKRRCHDVGFARMRNRVCCASAANQHCHPGQCCAASPRTITVASVVGKSTAPHTLLRMPWKRLRCLVFDRSQLGQTRFLEPSIRNTATQR